MTENDRANLLSEQAYQQIKLMIITLDLPPGSFVNEKELIERLDLGRTPIREALLRLSLEQLVNIIPRRGIAVSTIALSDLQHLYELRLSIETLAIRLAAQRGTKEQWQKMEDALDQVRAGSGRVSNETMIAVDEQCHQIIHDASGNPFLRNTATTLYAASLRLWYYCISEIGPMRQAVLEHEHMLAALRAGDEDQASSLMERHIRTFHQEIQRAIGAAELPQTLA